MIVLRSERFERNLAQAEELFNAGFSSKSKQKDALTRINSAYDEVCRDYLGHQLLLVMHDDAQPQERRDAYRDLYYSRPMYPHQWKAKHSKMFSMYPEVVELIEELVEFRNVVKDTEIVRPVKDDSEKKKVEAVQMSIKDMMEKRKAQYAEGLELSHLFGGMYVTANTHVVMNAHGTVFLRTFYYMHGKLTPLNMIIAVAEKLQAEKEGK